MPPAARLGDSTVHGGTITVGEPTVLIGGKPAARVTDMHVCPMVTGTVPHVGGPIAPAGCTSVLIGPMPAARVGDMAICTGPPDTIASGEFTVLIGDLAGGGGAGAGAAGTAAARSAMAALGQAEALINAREAGDPTCEVIPGVQPDEFAPQPLRNEPPPAQQQTALDHCTLKSLQLACSHMGARTYTLNVGQPDATGHRPNTLEVVSGPDGDLITVLAQLSKPYCDKHFPKPLTLAPGEFDSESNGPLEASAKLTAKPDLQFMQRLTKDPLSLLWPQKINPEKYRLRARTCAGLQQAEVHVYPDLSWTIALNIQIGKTQRRTYSPNKDNQRESSRSQGRTHKFQLEAKYGSRVIDYGSKLEAYLESALSALNLLADSTNTLSSTLGKWVGELEFQYPAIHIEGHWGWKEVDNSWRVGFARSIKYGFEPIFGFALNVDIVATVLAVIGTPLLGKLKRLLDKGGAEVGIYLQINGSIGGTMMHEWNTAMPAPVHKGEITGQLPIAIEGRVKLEKKWSFFSVSLSVGVGGSVGARSGIEAVLTGSHDNKGIFAQGNITLKAGELYFIAAQSAGFSLQRDEEAERKQRNEEAAESASGGSNLCTLWPKKKLIESEKLYFIKNGHET